MSLYTREKERGRELYSLTDTALFKCTEQHTIVNTPLEVFGLDIDWLPDNDYHNCNIIQQRNCRDRGAM